MKRQNLGPIKGIDEGFQKFEVPFGAKNVLYNPKSGQIMFEVDDSRFLCDEDWQYLNPLTDRFVKVDFKQTKEPFKGIPIYEL